MPNFLASFLLENLLSSAIRCTRSNASSASQADLSLTSQDNPLWIQLWRDQRSDEFHQTATNPLLMRFWLVLQIPRDRRIFVPMCGKSLDMLWLAQQGYEVIGVELSSLAIQAFFHKQGWQPQQRQQGEFTHWSYGNISIICGDYFALHASDLGSIDGVYDRASLTALPPQIRRPYLAHLRQLLPVTTRIFLLTIEDAFGGDPQQQRFGVDTELTQLCCDHYQIELIHVETLFEAPDQPAEYKAYCLVPR